MFIEQNNEKSEKKETREIKQKQHTKEQLLSLGAINKITKEYVYPKIANKKDKYICLVCNTDLILCQGQVRIYHFRHKIDNVNICNYYNNPTESQIHKDAKLLMKKILEMKIPIIITRKCTYCNIIEEFKIPEIAINSNIQLEYRFEYNGLKIADVAYVNNNNISYIFEIYNNHKTCDENRPEPWFEIDAKTLIHMVNDIYLTSLKIPCIRSKKCNICIDKKIYLIKEKNKKHILFFTEKLKNATLFNQKKKIKCILELLHNNVIINNISEVEERTEFYYIKITHTIINQNLEYNIKRNELYSDERSGKKGFYSIQDIINWYNSEKEYFNKCDSCYIVLSKNKKNELYCNNKRCNKSHNFGNCDYCNGTGFDNKNKKFECIFC
jgi:uncharacterized protein YkuJ